MSSDKEMPLMDHIRELKDRFVVTLVAIVITTMISFFFATDIIKILLLPSGRHTLISIDPTENFATIFRVAIFSGIALAMPVILYELYAYIAPALLPNEKRFVVTMGPFVLALFVGGMAFCYFVLLPNAISFLVNFGSEVIENQLRAATYLTFVTQFILGMGIVFEMPAIIFGLTKVGILKRAWLVKQRRYVFLLVFIVAAVLTPTPDPFNQSIVALPMYLLFELGLLLARFA